MKIILMYIVIAIVLILIFNIIFYGINFNINSLQLSANNIVIYLIPAIIISTISEGKHNYVGLCNCKKNQQYQTFLFNIIPVIEIIIGIVLAVISIGVITFILWMVGDIKYTYRYNSFNILWILNDAAVEELVFRGFIFQYIYSHYPNIIIVLISALIFTCLHFILLEFNILLFINIFIVGLLFAFMCVKTKSLWMSISFHFIWNIMQLTILNSLFIVNDKSYTSFESSFITTLILLINLFIVLKFSSKKQNLTIL